MSADFKSFDPLIPIRIDLTLSGRRFVDTFLWNIEEGEESMRAFARTVVVDTSLPHSAEELIVSSIREQVAGYIPYRSPEEEIGERRHILKLDIRIGKVVLRDQFEWDRSNADNSPEEFAETLCKDLGLTREFVPAVAHAIREQLQELAEHPYTRCLQGSVPASGIYRKPETLSQWQPVVEILTDDQLEKLERRETRDARVARRNKGRESIRSGTGTTVSYPEPNVRKRPLRSFGNGYDFFNSSKAKIADSEAEQQPLYKRASKVPKPQTSPTPLDVMYSNPIGIANNRRMEIQQRMSNFSYSIGRGSFSSHQPLMRAPSFDEDIRCQNCGIPRRDTPLMRAGPAGN
ncbi:Chromatin structure-remodeling complex protein BSH [Galdieria sulphuraria]|nr:Chromatin structure-remodeling complex protein BSH [Galdieria sulphuraria]